MGQQYGSLPTGQRQVLSEQRDPRAAPMVMPPQPPLGQVAAQQQAQSPQMQAILQAIAQAMSQQPETSMQGDALRQAMLSQMQGGAR